MPLKNIIRIELWICCPNVYANLCWAWTVNPSATERGLCELIDAVPYNKIIAFGGDFGLRFETVGYAIQARRGIASALEHAIARGSISLQSAQAIAEAIMFSNGTVQGVWRSA